MKVSSRLIDDVVVISLSGKLMGGPDTSEAVKNEIYKILIIKCNHIDTPFVTLLRAESS